MSLTGSIGPPTATTPSSSASLGSGKVRGSLARFIVGISIQDVALLRTAAVLVERAAEVLLGLLEDLPLAGAKPEKRNQRTHRCADSILAELSLIAWLGETIDVVEAGLQLSLKAGGSFIDIGPAGVSIQGAMVMINSGGAPGSGGGSSPTEPTDAAEAAPDEPEKADDSKSGQVSTPF